MGRNKSIFNIATGDMKDEGHVLFRKRREMDGGIDNGYSYLSKIELEYNIFWDHNHNLGRPINPFKKCFKARRKND